MGFLGEVSAYLRSAMAKNMIKKFRTRSGMLSYRQKGMLELPPDILYLITSKLPLQDLMRVALVSKDFKRIWSQFQPPTDENLPRCFMRENFARFKEISFLNLNEGTRSINLLCDSKDDNTDIVHWVFYCTCYHQVSSLVIHNGNIKPKIPPFHYFKKVELIDCYVPVTLRMPYLEELRICRCQYELNSPRLISAPNLKILELEAVEIPSMPVQAAFVLMAPKLVSLYMKGYLCYNYQFKLTGLQDVYLDIKYSKSPHTGEGNRLLQLLKGISDCKNLNLTVPSPHHLTQETFRKGCFFPKMKNLCIKINDGSEDELEFVKAIVTNSPKLRNIALHFPRKTSDEMSSEFEEQVSRFLAARVTILTM